MGFFFRRSANFGPFRWNFSKSGIGASIGVRGARVTMTPRGTTYVTVGSHGFYYRETLSHRSGNRFQVTPPSDLTPPAAAGDEVATADVAELVDSSNTTLIQRLNERAQMFNPAWIICISALAILVLALIALSGSQPVFRAVGSPTAGTNTQDQYTALVLQFGYPDSVVASKLGLVPIRAASYDAAHLQVTFIPNPCVEAYTAAKRIVDDVSRYPALGRQEAKDAKPCDTSPSNGWAIVRYFDTAEKWNIPANTAEEHLRDDPTKKTLPPVIVTDKPEPKKQRPISAAVKNKSSKAVSKPDTQIWVLQEDVKRSIETASARARFFGFWGMILGVCFLASGLVIHRHNAEKRTTRLFYELNEIEQQKYAIVKQAFAHLGRSQQIWRIESNSATRDWKRNAGASSLVRRVGVGLGVSAPPRVLTNVSIPYMDISPARLFFLPDVILYFERGTFGGLSYEDFHVEQRVTRFIEEEQVPSDARVIDQTWRYVNKSGGPDRRFNNNARLPVAQYGVLILTSSQGLNIHLNTSNLEATIAFANCWSTRQCRPKENLQSKPPRLPDAALTAEEGALRILGFDQTASVGEISASYHKLAQMYHPDKVAGLAPEFQALAELRMKEINAAFNTLRKRSA